MNRAIMAGLAILVLFGVIQPAIAQNSTPTARSCPIPALVTVPEFPSGMAVPAASPSGTPESTPVSAAVPASEEIAKELDTLTQAIAECISIGDAEAVGAMTTSEFRGDLFGGGIRLSLDEYLAIAATAPVVRMTIRSITNATIDGELTAGADIQLVRGNQLFNERWTFLFREESSVAGTPVAAGQGVWRAHRIQPLAVSAPEGASSVDVTLDEYVTRVQRPSVQGPNVVLSGKNAGQEAHEMLVIHLSAGATVDDLLLPSPGGFPAGIAIVGELTLLPGETGDLILVDLKPGRYVIFCLLPDERGVPHLSFGQKTNLEIK